MESIVHPRMDGLILISGLYGIGKTTLATTLERPELMAVVDFDLKFEALAAENGIWYRSPADMVTGDKDRVLDIDIPALTAWFGSVLREIQDKTVLVIDNATFLEDMLADVVKRNPTRYGVNEKNAKTGYYGGVHPGVSKLWSRLVSALKSRGIKVIVAVTHMSQDWYNGVPVPNKYHAKGNKMLMQLANLALVLVPGATKDSPAALVLKEQLISRHFDRGSGQWVTRSPLPPRIPVAQWPRIYQYFKDPFNPQQAQVGEELWTPEERASYGTFMTAKQVAFVEKVTSYEERDAEYEERDAEVEVDYVSEVKAAWVKAAEEHPDIDLDVKASAEEKKAQWDKVIAIIGGPYENLGHAADYEATKAAGLKQISAYRWNRDKSVVEKFHSYLGQRSLALERVEKAMGCALGEYEGTKAQAMQLVRELAE